MDILPKNTQQFDNTITVHKLAVDSVKHTISPEVNSIKMRRYFSFHVFGEYVWKNDLMYKSQILEIHGNCHLKLLPDLVK